MLPKEMLKFCKNYYALLILHGICIRQPIDDDDDENSNSSMMMMMIKENSTFQFCIIMCLEI